MTTAPQSAPIHRHCITTTAENHPARSVIFRSHMSDSAGQATQMPTHTAGQRRNLGALGVNSKHPTNGPVRRRQPRLSLACHQWANHQGATHTTGELRLYSSLHVRHSGHLEKEKECELWSHTNLGLSPEDSSTGRVARGRPVNHSAPQLSVSKMGRLSFPCQPTSVV